MTARQFAKHRETFCLASAGSDEEFHAYLSGFDAAVAIADLAAAPAQAPEGVAHIIEYTNWRGETSRRTIRPIRMWWGKTEWHPEEQWMLTAHDCEKDAVRDFAWQDMRPVRNPATSAATEPQPDPRDAVIARLVEALENRLHDQECPCNACSPMLAALAAAKAVQHD